MKILFVSPGALYSERHPFERGGTESQIYGISREMVQRGHDVYVTGRFHDFGTKECEIVDGVKYINIRSSHLKDEIIYEIGSALLYSKRVVKKIIQQIRPDIISLNERFSGYFPSKLNIPKTFTTHNPTAFAFYRDFAIKNNGLNSLFYYFRKRFEDSVMAHTEKIIVLNKEIGDYLYAKGFTNNCLIPNGIDVDKYANKCDNNFVLYAGRLHKVKGIDCLIQAFSETINDYDADLIIVGSGSEEKALRQLATSKNVGKRVHFIPLLDKAGLRKYLSECSVFVLPSLFECMPVTLLEAMASGKPVIASDIPGSQDVITHGHNGFLFEKGKVYELKKHLRLCLSDLELRTKLGNNARQTAEERYSFSKIAEQYLEVYDQIL